MRLSDLYDNLHSVLRFLVIGIIILSGQNRNKYCLKRIRLLTETVLRYSRIVSDSFSSLFKALRSSCSRIIWNFQKFTQEKQRDRI